MAKLVFLTKNPESILKVLSEVTNLKNATLDAAKNIYSFDGAVTQLQSLDNSASKWVLNICKDSYPKEIRDEIFKTLILQTKDTVKFAIYLDTDSIQSQTFFIINFFNHNACLLVDKKFNGRDQDFPFDNAVYSFKRKFEHTEIKEQYDELKLKVALSVKPYSGEVIISKAYRNDQLVALKNNEINDFENYNYISYEIPQSNPLQKATCASIVHNHNPKACFVADFDIEKALEDISVFVSLLDGRDLLSAMVGF